MQEGKTVSGFKRLFAYLVTEKLPRFACLLPARGARNTPGRPGGAGGFFRVGAGGGGQGEI
ncbi:hypothetical protein E5S62_22905, partial [Escherichia coli]